MYGVSYPTNRPWVVLADDETAMLGADAGWFVAGWYIAADDTNRYNSKVANDGGDGDDG